MAKRKAAPVEPVEELVEPVFWPVYCTPGDLVGTARPDGGHITAVSVDDAAYIAQAAANVHDALQLHPDADAKATIQAAKWANIVGAVDLRALGEFGPRYYDALAVLTPSDG